MGSPTMFSCSMLEDASSRGYRVLSGTAWCNAVTDAPTRAVVAHIEAQRIDTRGGRAVHSAVCPFCRAEAIDAGGEETGCPHLKDLEHRMSGVSYFTFERPL